MNYWIIQNGVRLGPLSLDEVKRLGVTTQTPVWRAGLANWQPASSLPELSDSLSCYTMPPLPQDTRIYNAANATGYNNTQSVHSEQQPMPPTYLPWAIVVTLLCCIFTGVVAIVYASKVSSLYYRGDYVGAQKASSNSALWIAISVVAGLLWIPVQTLIALAVQ